MPSLKTDATTWTRIRAKFCATGDASAVLSQRTALVDGIMRAGFAECLEPAFPKGLALLAVGGYGRRELFPYSDVDLLVLVEKFPQGKERKEALSLFLREMWDSDLRLSHSVREVAECCELHDQNIELNISLLDQRFLAGDRSLYDSLAAGLPKFLKSQSGQLARHLAKLARARHAKFQDTIYHMEPNIKEMPGGLRDLHSIWWLRQLRDDEAISAEWRGRLAPAREFLDALRCFLHYRAGRDSNGLIFELQDEITQQPWVPEKDPAAWMREYFRHARAIHQACTRTLESAEGPGGNLLAQFRDWRSRLSNSEFTVARERVLLKNPQQLTVDPEMTLRLFQFVARHGMRLALDTERRLADSLPLIQHHFATSRPVWPAVKELLSLPHVALALRAMNETGVLAAVFPEWKRIECLVVRDFYQRYTVDEHTLVAIQKLTDLRQTKDPARRRFADLLAEVDQPAVLLLALLFHDIGKGGGEGRHVAASRPLLDAAMTRIQARPTVRQEAWELIEQHLALSATMVSRDLDDPATARELAGRLGTVEQLSRLALLTYADISAVHPAAMNPWRLEQLWRVYLCTYRELTRELDSDRIETPPVRSAELAAFLEGFPKRYLRTHTEEQIQADFALAGRSREIGVAIDIRRLNGVFSAEIVARDRAGLFASIAGALSSFGLNIVKAEAFGNRHGEVLDSFVFTDPSHTLELNPPEVDRLRLTIERVVLGRAEVKELLRHRPKPSAPTKSSEVRPSVFFDSEASAASTLVEIVAQDRPGLLYDLASRFSGAGCNIEVVLIDTEAHKALDVFYLTRAGKKLTAAEEAELRGGLLKVCRG